MTTASFEVRGLADVRELVAGILQTYPRAVREGVNHLVASTRLREIDEIKAVYQQPVPYTTAGVLYRAMRTDGDFDRAGVYFRGSAGYGGTEGVGAVRYLPPTVEGRARRHKPFENAVIASAANAEAQILSAGDYLVPGPYPFYRDTNGNVKAAIIGKIAADLGLPGATRTGVANRSFFLAKIGTLRGIFERSISAGVVGRPLLVFAATSRAPSYEQRFDFFGVGERHLESKYREYFGQALDRAIGRA